VIGGLLFATCYTLFFVADRLQPAAAGKPQKMLRARKRNEPGRNWRSGATSFDGAQGQPHDSPQAGPFDGAHAGPSRRTAARRPGAVNL